MKTANNTHLLEMCELTEDILLKGFISCRDTIAPDAWHSGAQYMCVATWFLFLPVRVAVPVSPAVPAVSLLWAGNSNIRVFNFEKEFMPRSAKEHFPVQRDQIGNT